MSLALRPDETIRAQAHIHWISYARPFLSGVAISVLVAFSVVEILKNNPDTTLTQSLPLFPLAALGFLPMLIRWLKNRARKFIVTNQRIFLEEGLLSKYSNEIPLGKINDVTMRQSLFQRMLGAGDITVLTGNDFNTAFQNLADPQAFREAISQGR